jgi:hypothetical protein
MRSPHARNLLSAALLALAVLAGCSGGSSIPATVTGSIEPCYAPPTPPAFDVWQGSFGTSNSNPTANPTSQTPIPTPTAIVLTVNVNTINSENASEFRLTVSCLGAVVIPATTTGAPCSFPPPARTPGETPECPLASVDLTSLGLANLGRVTCLAEIGPTEPLDTGVGACANPSRADYALRMDINNSPVGLDLVAHDCFAQDSCLMEFFGITLPTPTPTATDIDGAL